MNNKLVVIMSSEMFISVDGKDASQIMKTIIDTFHKLRLNAEMSVGNFGENGDLNLIITKMSEDNPKYTEEVFISTYRNDRIVDDTGDVISDKTDDFLCKELNRIWSYKEFSLESIEEEQEI